MGRVKALQKTRFSRHANYLARSIAKATRPSREPHCRGARASSQERPYVSRPSRSQQLRNPKLVPKLTNDTPNPVEKKKGLADEILAKQEAQRTRLQELEERDESDAFEVTKVIKTPSSAKVSVAETKSFVRSCSEGRLAAAQHQPQSITPGAQTSLAITRQLVAQALTIAGIGEAKTEFFLRRCWKRCVTTAQHQSQSLACGMNLTLDTALSTAHSLRSHRAGDIEVVEVVEVAEVVAEVEEVEEVEEVAHRTTVAVEEIRTLKQRGSEV
ncbi:hypothetical protein E4U39_003169 [Claviceps sp. Clav50 group G5]|nr:hypothetical protein E4U39_003169 [Claviceps sp. Clav50 group G5]